MQYLLKMLLILSFILEGSLLSNTGAMNTQIISLVNTSHLDNLYRNINYDNREMGIVLIYADYPDYHTVDAKGEGIACVDDAARALVFYIRYYNVTNNKIILTKIRRLTNFLIYMQAGNGFFYNFIWKDYTRDTTYKTSVAEPNWWSWRAVWGLAEALKFYNKRDTAAFNQIVPVLEKGVASACAWLNKYQYNSKSSYGGFELPSWLPSETASDQAAIIVKAFSVCFELNSKPAIKKTIERMCNGIIQMQAGDNKNFPYNAFLSWQNTWHMWGNSQSDALICAGKLLNKPEYIKCALKEVKNFYPFLINNNYLNNFSIEKHSGRILMKDSNKFAQIAYGIRPVVMACLRTGDSVSAVLAGQAAAWLLGKNIAGKALYNPENGICFDGINNENELNKNSGAESTIESLLILLAIEQNPIAYKTLSEFYENHKN
ncbi:MAG: hypothetical protein WCA84_11515 [Ignavibacteriaceae bacterium]